MLTTIHRDIVFHSFLRYSYGKDCFLTEETTFSQGENTVIHKGQQMRGGKNEKVCSILFIYRQARSG